jgi:hypothetical protein
MSGWQNADGPQGTVAQLRQTNPLAAETGPEPGSPLGTMEPPGHGQAIDQMLASHEARLAALESPGPADGESWAGE